jgi:protein-S-isoprenylcysteine O-methyltransferase Ste14
MLKAIISKIGVWNAWIFMSVFLVQMLIILLSNRATRKRSHVSPEHRKNVRDRYIGPIANLVWLTALIYSIFLPLRLGTMWFSAGFTVFLIGVLVLSWSTYDFMTTPEDKIIQKGIYKYSRHPMYLATFLICLAAGIAAVSYLFILLSLLIMICFHYEAILEEKCCLEEYGTLYEAYMNRVPRWIGIPK